MSSGTGVGQAAEAVGSGLFQGVMVVTGGAIALTIGVWFLRNLLHVLWLAFPYIGGGAVLLAGLAVVVWRAHRSPRAEVFAEAERVAARQARATVARPRPQRRALPEARPQVIYMQSEVVRPELPALSPPAVAGLEELGRAVVAARQAIQPERKSIRG